MLRVLDDYLMSFLASPWNVIAAAVFLFLLVLAFVYAPYVRLIAKSLTRNLLRTLLTGAATFLLVLIITLILSVLWLLDLVTTERSKDFKAIVTERWQLPSQMPFSYANSLKDGAASKPGDIRPQDHMTWQFYGGTLDEKKTRESLVFFFCMEPSKALTMLDISDHMTAKEEADLHAAVKALEEDPRRILVGIERLKAMNKKVGERISLYGMNYPGIDLDDCEIYGVLPDGGLNQLAIMNRDRLNNALEAYKRKNGKAHPLADKSLNLVWLKVPDTEAYNRVAQQVLDSPSFTDPAVKIETASSGFAAFLDAYRDLLKWVKWFIIPAILVTLSMVIATAISLSVRERRIEMAVLKVLGFGPTQIMFMVLVEALLIGVVSGLLSAVGTFLFVNQVLGGIKFPIGFFPAFRIPLAALWWGPGLGAVTALAGSIVPAWSARSVKVSEVFAKLS
ncbi:MAG TPA: ABC transporter permease [Gemmataceae bacterium]|jgi:putative ABC transport system permease protein